MNQLGPFLVLIGVAAVILAAFGGVVAWWNEEGRRIRRGLRKVLKAEPHALIIAHGSGRGAGFNFTSNAMAVTWDTGGWCLIYQIEELLGVELVVDGQVTGRAYRGEVRRPVDQVGGAERQVSLRLIFDDPQHADFILTLWGAAGGRRRPVMNANEAAEEGNRWLARLESIFRRQPTSLAGARVARPAAAAAPEPAPVVTEPPPAPTTTPPALMAAPSAAAAPPPRPSATAQPAPAGRQELPFEDEPPWDEDDQQALL